MRRGLLGVAVIGVILSIIYLLCSAKYPMGSWRDPGPGLYPLLVGILILICSLGTALEARYEMANEKIGWPRGADLSRIVGLVVAMFAYFILLPFVGHLIASLGVVFAGLHLMGGLRWPLKILLTFSISGGSYYLFVILLAVPLPKGELFG